MKKIIYSCLLISLLAYACNQKEQEKTTTKTAGSGAPLTEASLYDLNAIKSYLTGITEKQQEEGKKKFLEAIDLIKNKKQVQQSIAGFKAAALIFPSDKTYFELGSALLENKEYPEATKALKVAEAMGYSPMANVMYKLSALYAQMRDTATTQYSGILVNDSLSMHYMEVALQMGYSNPEQFMHDKVFDSVRYYSDWEYKNRYNTAMSGNKDPEKLVWDNYKAGFKDLKLPLVVNTVSIYNQKYEDAIGYDFEKFVPEMRTGKFSREVDNEYYYAGKIKEDPTYTALMYAGKNMWVTDGRGYSPVYLFLVTYTPSGKIIDKMLVGGQRSFADNFRTLSLKENLYFELKDYKNVYEQDPDIKGYENNKITRSDLLSTTNYRINNAGKIEKTEQLAMR